MSVRSKGTTMPSIAQRPYTLECFLNWFALYCFLHLFFFLLIKLQTLPDQEEAKKVMVLNTFSFPSTCLRQTYRITSMVKRF